MTAWKTLNRRLIFDQPPWLKVEYHEVELPNGCIIPDWTWIKIPDYVNVVVQTEDGIFLCFRQLKYAVDGLMLALVGGYIEPDETPLAAAQRELREETGYISEDWQSLGDYVVDPNRGIATGHLYLARRAKQVTAIDSDDLEEQEMVFLSRNDLESALLKGEFKILSWATAVSFALLRIPEG
jgi:ADP-ribose pyrophosphatase